LAAANGFYESPSGELIFYAASHENNGPADTVKAGEWRHNTMVRENSPTMLPTAMVNGPYEVDEGSSVNLTGAAEPSTTKAWIQLFTGTDLTGFYPAVDFDDYALDDFDDLSKIDHANVARSWNWFAPQGCSIATINFEGGVVHARILEGTGLLEQESDLSQNYPDMDQKVDAVEFLEDCDDYYAAPVELQWDLDLNGTYETTGSPVTFNALAFDGPGTVHVPARAQHSSGGPPGEATAVVTVRNVPPTLAQFRVTNGAGQLVNVDVPFVLTHVPVTVSADFGDPGVLDHQTATLDWGDGSVDPNTAFATFDEAFGDGTGALTHAHPYTLSDTYTIAISVLDDDGGEDAESMVVRVVTPEQAVQEILSLLDGIIAGTTNTRVLKELQKARKAIAGSISGFSKNGALFMIKISNDDAAIAFLQETIFWLKVAQARGADVATLIELFVQVIAALSAA